MAKRTAPTIKLGDTVYRDATIETPKDQGGRTKRFVISDESEDRMGDVIVTNGWQFKNFETNPIVLWAHQSRELPIGTAAIMSESTRTLADITFATADENPFAESVFRLVNAGIIRATSVGFRALAPPEPRFDTEGDWVGFKFIAQELLELSVCNIPALPSALAVGKSLGVSDADLSRLLDPAGVPVDPEQAKAVAAAMRAAVRNLEMRGLKL